MEANANTITTMGIISDEVYKSIYFANKPINEIEPLKANNHTYKVIDHTPDTNPLGLGFNALLLEETIKQSDGTFVSTGNYTIAFRGTEGLGFDALVDLAIAGHYNAQYSAAVDFVNRAIGKTYDGATISKDNLTLTGHSLGGILTQQVGATMQIKGYAYNPWGANALVRYPNTGNILLDILSAVNAGGAVNWAKNNTEDGVNFINNTTYSPLLAPISNNFSVTCNKVA